VKAGLTVGLATAALTACSSGDQPDIVTLPETPAASETTETTGADLNSPDPAVETVSSAVEAGGDYLLPDGRVLSTDEALATRAYLQYIDAQNAGGLSRSDGESLASGNALTALLAAAGEGTAGGDSVTTAGIIDVESSARTVTLSTCDLADLGENSLLDDGTHLIDPRGHEVTVDITADGPIISSVVRVSSGIMEGRFCASVEDQTELIDMFFSGMETFTEIAAGNGEASDLEEWFDEPILSFFTDRVESTPGSAVGGVELARGEVVDFVPNFQGRVMLCLVYPDGIQVLDDDGEVVDTEPAGIEVPMVALARKASADSDWALTDVDFDPAEAVCP